VIKNATKNINIFGRKMDFILASWRQFFRSSQVFGC